MLFIGQFLIYNLQWPLKISLLIKGILMLISELFKNIHYNNIIKEKKCEIHYLQQTVYN